MMLRSVLNYPAAYRLFTSIVGGSRSRRRFSENFIRARDGDRILDLGCGPADLVEYLPHVEYIGFDTNPAYIKNAKARWGDRATFVCGHVGDASGQLSGTFDIVLAVGVVHHLNDDEAVELFRVAFGALRPGGRLVTFDGAFVKGQSPVARFLLSKDRGGFVREVPDYERLARSSFAGVTSHVAHDLIAPVPYTHLVMECVKQD